MLKRIEKELRKHLLEDDKEVKGVYLSPDENNNLTLIYFVDDKPMRTLKLTNGLSLYLANRILDKCNTGLDIEFKNFHQYNKLIQEVNSCLG